MSTLEGSLQLFEYLASGIPIISIGQNSSFDASQIIQKAQAGFVCGNDNVLKRQLWMSKKKNILISLIINLSKNFQEKSEPVRKFLSTKLKRRF